MTVETDRTLFDERIKRDCVADFYTTGCPVCEKLASVFEEASEMFPDMAFLKVNLDEDITLAERYGIDHVPTLMLFRGGEPTGTNTGYLDKDALSAFIQSGKVAGA